MGKRIGVARQLFNNSPSLNELMEIQLATLRAAGATLIDVQFESMTELSNAETEVLLYEFKTDLNNYLQQRGGDMQSLQDLITFNRDNAQQEMPYFGQELFEQAQAKGDLSEQAYLTALRTSKNLSQARGIDLLISQHQLDAFVAPGNDVAWLIDLISGDSSGSYIGSSTLAAVSGYPSITVPAGFIKQLPIGILFFGAAFSEPTLIAIAYDYEQRSKARQAPEFHPTFK